MLIYSLKEKSNFLKQWMSIPTLLSHNEGCSPTRKHEAPNALPLSLDESTLNATERFKVIFRSSCKRFLRSSGNEKLSRHEESYLDWIYRWYSKAKSRFNSLEDKKSSNALKTLTFLV
jgi:hypothetical protein